MSVKTFSNLPESIPVDTAVPQIVNSATPKQSTPATPAPVANNKPIKEVKSMTLEELKQAEPELVTQIEASAASEARHQAITDERARLQAIQEIAATVGDQEMVNEAMYGENACTASELALRAMQKQAKLGTQHLKNSAADFKASGAAGVAADPNAGNEAPEGKADSDEMSEADAVAMIAGTYDNKNTEGK